jgi:hypothetical protein
VGTQLNGSDNDDRQLFCGDIVAHTVESIVALDREWRLRALLHNSYASPKSLYAKLTQSTGEAGELRSNGHVVEPMSSIDRRC